MCSYTYICCFPTAGRDCNGCLGLLWRSNGSSSARAEAMECNGHSMYGWTQTSMMFLVNKWNMYDISHIYPIYIPYIYIPWDLFSMAILGVWIGIYPNWWRLSRSNGHKAIQLGGVSPEVYIGLKIDQKYMVGTSNLASWNGIPISDGWYMGRFSSYVAKCEGPRKLQGWTTDGW